MKRILTVEGITINASEEKMYTIVVGTDGHDYIVEEVNGEKVWNLYGKYTDTSNEIVFIDHTETAIEEEPIKKKLHKIDKSLYHAFISDYISQHKEIPWNERMKAANEAYKNCKPV